jgi:polyisoprenoid-binding protein YceI
MIRANAEKTRAGMVALLALLPVLGLNAAEKADQPSATYTGTANVRFYGTSTLHDFEGQVTSRPFKLTIEGDGKWSADADAPVAQMSTDNKRRDNNMYEMLGSSVFPSLHGSVKNAPVPRGGSQVVQGTLKIRNVEHKVPVTISGWKRDGDSVSFHGEAAVSLSAYGLKAPSVMGVVRVGDTVTLRADVTAKSETGARKANREKGADE